MEINFTIKDENDGSDIVAKLGLEGLTFEEFFKKLIIESKKAHQKLREKFGDDKVWTPEKEKFLSPEENLWVRLSDYYYRFAHDIPYEK